MKELIRKYDFFSLDEWLDDYIKLVERVYKIDPEAGDILSSEEFISHPSFRPCARLESIRIWKDAPQGHDYWSNIREKLR